MVHWLCWQWGGGRIPQTAPPLRGRDLPMTPQNTHRAPPLRGRDLLMKPQKSSQNSNFERQRFAHDTPKPPQSSTFENQRLAHQTPKHPQSPAGARWGRGCSGFEQTELKTLFRQFLNLTVPFSRMRTALQGVKLLVPVGLSRAVPWDFPQDLKPSQLRLFQLCL